MRIGIGNDHVAVAYDKLWSIKQQGEEKKKTENNKLMYFNFIGNCQVPQKVNIEKMA